MKNTSYLPLALAGLLLAACLPETGTPVVEDYAGNHVVVTAPESVIPAEGGIYEIQVVSDVPLEVSIPKVASWLTATVSQDEGTISMPEMDGEEIVYRDRPYSIVTFRAAANEGLDRYASVAVIDADTKFSLYRLDVHQAGAIVEIVKKDFMVSPLTISVEADATSAQIEVVAEVAWTAVSSNPAIVLNPASGSGNATVNVSFPANASTENAVTSVITFSTDDPAAKISSHEVNFSQKAAKVDKPAVKPAPGTVLAEWEFDSPRAEALRGGGWQSTPDNSIEDVPGNYGDIYVPSIVSGDGRLEYYNGTDKSGVSTTKHKRRIGERGEPCIYCVFEGDYILWKATADAPLAAGTKIKINFALRPNHESVMKYWKCEFLDGDTWKELDTYELFYYPNAAGTQEDPKQVNTFIDQTATLTVDTPYAAFRFTATPNAQCGSGSPLAAISSKSVLRFAGKWSEALAENAYLQVPENPKIVVVE